MKIPYYVVDSFTDKVFKGNPAGVCLLPSALPNEKMQSIASENNLSETAFIFKEKGQEEYTIKWFTPTIEMDLCGHATLAAGYILLKKDLSLNEISFNSLSGSLRVFKQGDIVYLDFPSRPAKREDLTPKLAECFNLSPLEVLKSRDYLFIFRNEQQIREIQPNFEIFKNLDCTGVIVSAKGDQYDFVSRFFAPQAGVYEDPVTGSSHCTLIPYWSNILEKDALLAYQLSSRGGKLYCEMRKNRVLIGGSCILYLEGDIFV